MCVQSTLVTHAGIAVSTRMLKLSVHEAVFVFGGMLLTSVVRCCLFAWMAFLVFHFVFQKDKEKAALDQQQAQAQAEMDEQAMSQREREIERVARSINDLANVFHELSVLVVEQVSLLVLTIYSVLWLPFTHTFAYIYTQSLCCCCTFTSSINTRLFA